MLEIELDGQVAIVTMTPQGKRNAMCDELLDAIAAFFDNPPDGIRVVILTGTEGHYCSGLDLSEHVQRAAEESLYHSRAWHKVMDQIQFGGFSRGTLGGRVHGPTPFPSKSNMSRFKARNL